LEKFYAFRPKLATPNCEKIHERFQRTSCVIRGGFKGVTSRGTLTKHRAVHPCRVAYVNNLSTLFAFDPKADDIRKFVFFRVTQLEVTDELFTVVHRLDLNKELEGSMGVFKGSEKHEVVIEFDA
jgi:hypothetical protein